jgi:AraC family transcriptional regulator
MELRIEKRGKLTLTGLPLRVSCEGGANMREIPAFWSECHARGYVDTLARAIPRGSTLNVMGVCMNDLDEESKTFTYLVAIERPTDPRVRQGLPAGCVDVAVPAATWAVFTSRGPLPDAIQGVWKRIYAEWFPTSGYEHAGAPDLEVYPTGDMRAANYTCEIWLPVRKAGEE